MIGKPISNRKKVNLMIALTILAWATQTLLHQWARGQDVAPDAAAPERFVPSDARENSGATLEMRAEATLGGEEIKLKQICRWANADNNVLGAAGELTVGHMAGSSPFVSISLDEVRRTLKDAGVNLGAIHFAGAIACTITRTDVKYDEAAALREWVGARDGKSPAAPPQDIPATGLARATSALPIQPADVASAKAPADASPVKTLRDLIMADAAARLNLPADSLQINFSPADEKFLNLAEPQFKFNLAARRVYGLGEAAWDVSIITDLGSKKVPIVATVRAWQEQTVLVRAVPYHGVLQDADVLKKRILSERLPDDPLLAYDQCVGQQAARELRPGTVLTAPMVSPVDLAKPGQFITVTLVTGSVRIKTVAVAMEAGAYGQSVRAKNEATNAIYEVVLTGPQEGTISPPDFGKKVASVKE